MWKKIKEIPPFITSIIAIIAAVIGVTTWVFGYFATRSELEKVHSWAENEMKKIHCWAEINITINSRQIAQSTLLAKYFQEKACINALERERDSQSLTQFEKEALGEHLKLFASYEEEIKALKKQSDKLLDIVRSRNIIDANGECKCKEVKYE